MAELLYFPKSISSNDRKLGEIADQIPELISRLEWCHTQLGVVIGDCRDGTIKQLLTQQSATVGRLIAIARKQAARVVRATR